MSPLLCTLHSEFGVAKGRAGGGSWKTKLFKLDCYDMSTSNLPMPSSKLASRSRPALAEASKGTTFEVCSKQFVRTNRGLSPHALYHPFRPATGRPGSSEPFYINLFGLVFSANLALV